MITVADLLIERAGYVARGLPGRVAQVDAEIKRLSGVAVETADGPPADVETAVAPKARRR